MSSVRALIDAPMSDISHTNEPLVMGIPKANLVLPGIPHLEHLCSPSPWKLRCVQTGTLHKVPWVAHFDHLLVVTVPECKLTIATIYNLELLCPPSLRKVSIAPVRSSEIITTSHLHEAFMMLAPQADGCTNLQ